jgi:Tol biopolymer transport system component
LIETMHFDIYFPAGNDNFGRLVALMSEDTYYYLKNDFQFPAMSRIPIIFYGSQLEFQTTNIIYPLLSEGIGGFTESLKNRVAIPFDGSYSKLEETLTHELTHAYINALDSGSPGSFFYLKSFNFPFWFSEGLPEFESVGGSNVRNNAFIMDLVINDNMRSLTDISGYSAYRMGESFLVFINKQYGRDKLMDFFYTIRAINDLDKASSKVFGLKFKELESRWKTQLKRDFFPYINSHSVPNEYSDRKTNHRDDASGLNLSPRFAPDGIKYVYFSNKDGRFSIWTGDIFESTKNRKLITGEATGSMEEFHYFRSSLAWFPDNNRFAFVAKTSAGDKLYIADYKKEAIVEQIDISNLKSMYEIDISTDGNYCVISGQHNMQTDLFLYEFSSKKISQITNDNFSESEPKFSPDGKTIAFTSERTRVKEDFRKGYFSDLKTNIYLCNIKDNVLKQVTFDQSNCSYPVWDSTGTKLIFISERNNVPNLEIIDLSSSQRAVLTNALSGIYSYDLSANSQYLVYSCYFDGGWNIFMRVNPINELIYSNCDEPKPIDNEDNLFKDITLSRLDYFGKKKWHRPMTDGGPQVNNVNSTIINFKTANDSVLVKRDFAWDNKPDSISVLPVIKPYKIKLTLDRLWGGFAYSSSVGTIGSLELGLSDILGNHAIGVNLGISGKIKDSNIMISYLYLPHRIDYGIGVYNVLDEVIYRVYKTGLDDYYRQRERETGVYFLFRYPLSKFIRLDFENQLYTWEYHWDSWKWSSDGINGIWQNDTHTQNGIDYKIPMKTDLVYAPAVTFVHDNALYGPTGPLLGWRAFLTLRKSLAQHGNDYQTGFLDIRSYALFNKRYSMALRMVGGVSSGTRPQKFDLDGYYGIRGYTEEDEGRKIVMTNAELRFPFLDYLALAFPLPIVMTSIRGSAFCDIGSVWNSDKEFQGMDHDVLKDLKFGFGCGPRMNVGFAVLRFDIAWLTDFMQVSKPTYYFSLTEDF